MSTSFFHDMLGSIADRGRALIERSTTRSTTDRSERTAQKTRSPEDLEALCRDLLSGRGEASGGALARQILDLYASLAVEQRLDFFRLLAHDFDPDQQQLRSAWASYDQAPNPGSLQALLRAVEPPRQVPQQGWGRGRGSDGRAPPPMLPRGPTANPGRGPRGPPETLLSWLCAHFDPEWSGWPSAQ